LSRPGIMRLHNDTMFIVAMLVLSLSYILVVDSLA